MLVCKDYLKEGYMKERIKKLTALSLSVAMVAGLSACGNAATPVTEEQTPAGETATTETTEATTQTTEEETPQEITYDFGGVTVQAFGSEWNNLDNEENLVAQEAKKLVEEKYNIKLVKAAMDGYDGYNDDDLLIASVAAGDPVADIITLNPESMVSCYQNGILYDMTEYLDTLKVGSIYSNAGSWQGRCYGISYDNLGDSWVLVYDRDYLKEIGMEKTPTDMFMEGKWDYASFEEYCTEMKSKLPDGVYPIGCYPYHWAVMAAGANGETICDDQGNVNITKDAFIETLEFYQKLENEGLAYPMSLTLDENGEATEADYAYAVTDEKIVMKRAEAWQLSGLEFNYGIVYWPWGSDVTCNGDYTTLSDNYKVNTSYWGVDCVVAASIDKTGIPGDVLEQIIFDYREAVTDGGLDWMREAYEQERAGDNTCYGKEFGETRSFYTEQDIELYDWGHSRFQADLSWAMDSAGIVDVWNSFFYVLAGYQDARSTMESYYNEAQANLKDAGF